MHTHIHKWIQIKPGRLYQKQYTPVILYCGVQCYHWENLYKETVLTIAWGLSFSVVLLSSTVSNVADICCLCLDNTVSLPLENNMQSCLEELCPTPLEIVFVGLSIKMSHHPWTPGQSGSLFLEFLTWSKID